MAMTTPVPGNQAHVSQPALANEDLEDFFDNAALSLHWVGPDGTIIRANQFELDFLGYSRDEYEGRHIAEFHVDEDVIQDILERLTRGETLSDYEARLRAKDGSIKHVLINSNVRWVDGKFVHTRCFTRDITDRKSAEEALASANRELERKVAERTETLARYSAELERANHGLEHLVRLKNRFVAMVSHELRTPLTSISGFSLTMQRRWDSLPDDSKREFVHIIGEQANRLTRLVSDLLTLSRVASGALHTKPEPVEIAAAVEKTLAHLDEHDVAVAGAPGLEVLADPDHLQQMLVNYVTNALRYGRKPIEIDWRAAGKFVEIELRDAGEGVPEEFVPHLFEEFAQTRGTSEEPAPGTGLGLSIVRHLARANGGDTWYERNSPCGAVFGVRLPLQRDH